MVYKIKSIDLLVREIGPPRIDFAIGKGKSLFPEWMRFNIEVRMAVEAGDGRSAFGCSADWPSFGWLDKRTGIDPREKLVQLVELVLAARDAYLANASFKNPFDGWWQAREEFAQEHTGQPGVPLCRAFAISLFERALIDAVCRLNGCSFAESLRAEVTGFDPSRIHPELKGFDFPANLPRVPLQKISLRHTVGLNDPLTTDDVTESERLDDGLPQTLVDYMTQDGIRYLKIKVGSDVAINVERLKRIWSVATAIGVTPKITLDGNEAFDELGVFEEFVAKFAAELPEMFGQTLYIEQPLNRDRTHDPETADVIQQVAKQKPLIIDESDGYLHAFRDAIEIGYAGVSHKNCKGVFKSLANFALCQSRSDQNLFQSAEDLTSMPLVALQQDFAVIAAIGLEHAERNGHHFFAGLAYLSKAEKKQAAEYGGLYRQSDGEWFLNVIDGQVDVSALNQALGVRDLPDFDQRSRLEDWLDEFKQVLASEA